MVSFGQIEAEYEQNNDVQGQVQVLQSGPVEDAFSEVWVAVVYLETVHDHQVLDVQVELEVRRLGRNATRRAVQVVANFRIQ